MKQVITGLFFFTVIFIGNAVAKNYSITINYVPGDVELKIIKNWNIAMEGYDQAKEDCIEISNLNLEDINRIDSSINCIYDYIKLQMKKYDINYEEVVEAFHYRYLRLWDISGALRDYDLKMKYSTTKSDLDYYFEKWNAAKDKLSTGLREWPLDAKNELKKIAKSEQDAANKIVILEELEKEKESEKIIDGDPNKLVPVSSGSGFFVNFEGNIVTNNHVIDGCTKAELVMNGNAYEVKVISKDIVNDLAVLKTDFEPKDVYGLETSDAGLLEDVIIAGYPLGKEVSAAIKTSKGSITALAGYNNNYSEFQTDAAMNAGNSGGPIINQKGNIIGVAVADFGSKEGIEAFNFGIKSSTLNTFLSSNSIEIIRPNKNDLSNKNLGELISNATVYLECYMTVAEINQILKQNKETRKAFYSNINN